MKNLHTGYIYQYIRRNLVADSPTLEEHLAMHQAADANNAAPVSKAIHPLAKKQRSMNLKLEITLDTIVDWGKTHRGKQVEDLIYDQRDYMRWLVEKTDRNFSEDVIELMKKEGII